MRGLFRKFGNRVRELRKTKGWTQEQLAEESGLHTNYIGGIERGERNLSLINLGRLAKAFGISVSELLNEVGE